MSDLTKRLRNMYSKWSLSSCGPVILVEAADEIDRLRNVIRQFNCPRPCNGRPDDFTAGECLDAGECGCMASALRKSEARLEGYTPGFSAAIRALKGKPHD